MAGSEKLVEVGETNGFEDPGAESWRVAWLFAMFPDKIPDVLEEQIYVLKILPGIDHAMAYSLRMR